MSKIFRCNTCNQGFDQDNNPVGNAVPSIECIDGKHKGPIIPIQAGKLHKYSFPMMYDDVRRTKERTNVITMFSSALLSH
jgi:hypothetical protein